MLMSFEKYMDDELEFLKGIENFNTYPSVFDLICLLPLSKRAALVDETLFSLDDSNI